jgi:N-methylhydantoinase A
VSGATTAAPLTRNGDAQAASGGMRIGVDVGGTFTKAVAIEPAPFALVAEAVVPTSHEHGHGVNAGVGGALSSFFRTLC